MKINILQPKLLFPFTSLDNSELNRNFMIQQMIKIGYFVDKKIYSVIFEVVDYLLKYSKEKEEI